MERTTQPIKKKQVKFCRLGSQNFDESLVVSQPKKTKLKRNKWNIKKNKKQSNNDHDAKGQTSKKKSNFSKTCCFCWCCCCSCSCASIQDRDREDKKKKDESKELSFPYEEVVLWGKSFDKLLSHKNGREIFRSFLKSEFSEENVLFWSACEHLKTLTSAEVIEEEARTIYEDYISIFSPKEVSLDSEVREIIDKGMLHPSRHTFDQAQLQIYTLMQRDSYPRFINSPLYKNLLATASNRDSGDKLDNKADSTDDKNSRNVNKDEEETRKHNSNNNDVNKIFDNKDTKNSLKKNTENKKDNNHGINKNTHKTEKKAPETEQCAAHNEFSINLNPTNLPLNDKNPHMNPIESTSSSLDSTFPILPPSYVASKLTSNTSSGNPPKTSSILSRNNSSKKDSIKRQGSDVSTPCFVSYQPVLRITDTTSNGKSPTVPPVTTASCCMGDVIPKLGQTSRNNYIHKQHRHKQVNKSNKIPLPSNNPYDNMKNLYSNCGDNLNTTEVTMAEIQHQNSVEINYFISSHSDQTISQSENKNYKKVINETKSNNDESKNKPWHEIP